MRITNIEKFLSSTRQLLLHDKIQTNFFFPFVSCGVQDLDEQSSDS